MTSDIRSAITGALDIMQSLPDGLKIHFAEQTVALGTRLLGLKAMVNFYPDMYLYIFIYLCSRTYINMYIYMYIHVLKK
jgi:hypothetical protein